MGSASWDMIPPVGSEACGNGRAGRVVRVFGRDEAREVAAVVGVRPAVELRVGEVRVDPSGAVGVRDRPRPIDPPRAVLADAFEQEPLAAVGKRRRVRGYPVVRDAHSGEVQLPRPFGGPLVSSSSSAAIAAAGRGRSKNSDRARPYSPAGTDQCAMTGNGEVNHLRDRPVSWNLHRHTSAW